MKAESAQLRTHDDMILILYAIFPSTPMSKRVNTDSIPSKPSVQ